MNDFDDTTFARFARRFERIEQLVPDPVTPMFASVTNPKRGGAVMLRSVVILGATLMLGVVLALAAIGSRPDPSVTVLPSTVAPTAAGTMPPDSADATTVLDAYLGALRAGDCYRAGLFIGSYSSHTWNDALCGGVTRLTGYRIIGEPNGIGANEVLIETVLTTTGTAAGLPSGEVRFTFGLQPVGTAAWRVVDWYGGIPLDPSWQPFPTPTLVTSRLSK